jgi:hypothetical protein
LTAGKNNREIDFTIPGNRTMVDHNPRPTFALLRTDESTADITRIGRALAEPLGYKAADLVQVLSQRAGVLAEYLPEPTANRCISLLTQAGIEARMVPQSAIVDHPELIVLRSGRPDENVFFYVAPKRKGTVQWANLLWIDLVSVQELSTEECSDLEFDGGGGDLDAGGVRRVKSSRLVTKYPLFVDLVTSEPWLLLRIPQERFEFAATGLPTFTTRRENLIALAAVIASRAVTAHLGPGMKWVESNSPPREHRLQSQVIYKGFLRWQLTRLVLARTDSLADSHGPVC